MQTIGYTSPKRTFHQHLKRDMKVNWSAYPMILLLIVPFCIIFFYCLTAIILALSINEVQHKVFKHTVQTIRYMPHFISIIVVCSMLCLFLADDGIITGLAAFAAINPGLYKAARINGANRWQQTLRVTLSGITRAIVLLILRVGSLMSVGHEKIILLYNDFTKELSEVISTYVYNRGMIKGITPLPRQSVCSIRPSISCWWCSATG